MDAFIGCCFPCLNHFVFILTPFTDATKANAKRDSKEKPLKEPKKARKDAEPKAPAAEANADIVGSGRQAAQVTFNFIECSIPW